jgi:glycosyltransferase involved in cell wall biosynthesis
MSSYPIKSLRILHILTLNGANGEYGGPNRVAAELSINLQSRGHEVQIFTGALAHSIPVLRSDLNESSEIVTPLLKSFPTSSLWSHRIPMRLFRQIKQVDLVHIHFARELIPITAALLCVLLKKPYVTQTHGMVKKDGRMSTRIFDFLLTRFTLNRSLKNFVLTDQERREIEPFSFRCPVVELPNGIRVPNLQVPRNVNEVPSIVFCSRLHPRKRPDWFLGLAKAAHIRGLAANFEIYGPDDGSLNQIQKMIISDPDLERVRYKGSLQPHQVTEVLRSSDLLVLPSKNEPFPMVVLEALSVGTPALIMASSGIANLIRSHCSDLVVSTDTEESLFLAFSDVFNRITKIETRDKVRELCKEIFDIDKVVDVLEKNYMELVGLKS